VTVLAYDTAGDKTEVTILHKVTLQFVHSLLTKVLTVEEHNER